MRINSSLQALVFAATCAAQLVKENLRVLPLGGEQDSTFDPTQEYQLRLHTDSITQGLGQTDGEGYRGRLVQLLDGNQVNLIGCYIDGLSRDNQHDGVPGNTISSISNNADCPLPARPNVILLHAGTNDIGIFTYLHGSCSTAGATGCQDAANDLDALLYKLKPSGALIVVSKIGPFTNATVNANAVIFNRLVEKLVRAKDGPGTSWKIQLVDQGLSTSQLKDGVHPNDDGYNQMAGVWQRAIANASSNNLLPNPTAPVGSAVSPCTGSFPKWFDNNQVYQGRTSANSGIFGGVSCSGTGSTCNCKDTRGSNFTVTKTGSCDEMSLGYTSGVQFADLNGDGRDENVWLTSDARLNATLNTGSPKMYSGFITYQLNIQVSWTEKGIVGPTPPSGTQRYQVRLADIDGDSRAEYLVVNPNGSVDGWYNTGSPNVLNANIKFNFLSSSVRVAPSFGVSGVGVRLVDFNGDGLADYVWVSRNGAVQVWLNGGTPSNSASVSSWISQGSIGPAVLDGTLRENIVFADVDGDGRADYIIVSREHGLVGAYLNKAPSAGSKKPNWQFVDLKVPADSDGSNQFYADVQFADLDGDGRADYVVVAPTNAAISGQRNACY